MARMMALCSLPRTNPGNQHQYKRVNGNYRSSGLRSLHQNSPLSALCEEMKLLPARVVVAQLEMRCEKPVHLLPEPCRGPPDSRYVIRLLALVRYRSRIFQRAANVGAILQVVLNQSADYVRWVFPRREVGRRYDRDGPVCDQG